MITLHFHLQPQYKYELFHINFTSFHCTGRHELNKLTSLPMCGFIAQLVEHRTGMAEVTGSNPVEALIFFRLLLSNCLNWKIYCDDHSSLSITEYVIFFQLAVIIFFLSLLAAGIYGALQVESGLDLRDVVPRKSVEYKFVEARLKYFSFYPVALVTQDFDYANQQKKLLSYYGELKKVSG